jgi:deoxyribose-phosphate aldolase
LSAITPIDRSELEFDYGSFDAIGFAQSALASSQSLAAVMDSALLGPDATRDRVEKLCDEAVQNRFASVLVQPMWTSTAVAILAGTGVQVAVAIGLPFGSSLTSTMRHEAASVIRLGARELEMVIPIGQLKSGNHHGVQRTVSTVAQVAHHHNAKLKVIVETPALNVQEKLRVAGFHQDGNRLCSKWLLPCGCGSAAWRGWGSLRRLRIWWSPYPGRCQRYA